MRSGSLVVSALRLLSTACRVGAWALVALVVADAVLPAGPRSLLLGINGLVSGIIWPDLGSARLCHAVWGRVPG